MPNKPHTTHDPMPLDIRVSGASLSFDHHTVFHNLTFLAHGGQFTGILGPSGVGKTTLLKIIAGLLPTGTTEICDQHGSSIQGKIAWMSQKDLLLPWLSIFDNVCLGARLRGAITPQTQDRASSLLHQVGLTHVADKRPDALSGGMRQRAALVRTLMEDRQIILMDEPFSAVDPLTRIRLQDLSARLLHGRTVIFVTHDPLEALRLGHTIFVLNGQPATLKPIDLPNTAWPRPVDDPNVLMAQAEILTALAHSPQERTA